MDTPSECLSHYYGREAGLELREDIETVLEPEHDRLNRTNGDAS